MWRLQLPPSTIHDKERLQNVILGKFIIYSEVHAVKLFKQALWTAFFHMTSFSIIYNIHHFFLYFSICLLISISRQTKSQVSEVFETKEKNWWGGDLWRKLVYTKLGNKNLYKIFKKMYLMNQKTSSLWFLYADNNFNLRK